MPITSRPTVEIEALLAGIEDIRARTEWATVGLSDEDLLWSPNRNTWSIAQVLAHLNIAGWKLLPYLTNAAESLHKNGKLSEGPFRYSFKERMFIRFVSPDPPFRVPVPPGFDPPTSDTELTGALPRFLSLQDELIEAFRASSGLDLKAVQVPSVVDKRFKMCLGAWFHATVAHEQYHLLQVEALRAHPSFPVK